MGTVGSLSLTSVPAQLANDDYKKERELWGIQVFKKDQDDGVLVDAKFPDGWSIKEKGRNTVYIAANGTPVMSCFLKNDAHDPFASVHFFTPKEIEDRIGEEKKKADAKHDVSKLGDEKWTNDHYAVFVFASGRAHYESYFAGVEGPRRGDPSQFDTHTLIGYAKDSTNANAIKQVMTSFDQSLDVRTVQLKSILKNRWMMQHLTGYDSYTKETQSVVKFFDS